MKKTFSIIAAIISGLVVMFLITTCFIKTNVSIASNNPYQILVFDRSTTATKQNGYSAEDKEYNKVLKKLKSVSSVSIFKRLVNGTSLKVGVEQDIDNTFATWNTSFKQKNVVVELIYDKQQDLIVEYNGNTKVIYYYCISYVIPISDKLSDIVIYYATTNGSGKDNSYASNSPLVIKGETKNFVKFVESL